jgi:diguanylate cyclase (GGDEF)-like protein/PAS domain S-box-containing protein
LDNGDDDAGYGWHDGPVGSPVTDAGHRPADLVDPSEQRYRRMVELCPNAICVHESGRLVFANAATLRWIGAQSSADLVGRVISEFVHPDSMGPMLVRIAALHHDGDTSEPSEVVVMRADGTTLDVEAVSALTEWEGRPAYQVTFRDMSAQTARHTLLRYQAALVNHVSDAIVATTLTGIVTSWNPAAEAIYGRPATEVLALVVSEAVGAPLDPAAIIAGGGTVHTTHHAADGSLLAVRVSAAVMDNGYVLVCTDQTALRGAERRFQTVVDSLDVGVIVVGSDGRFESVNPAAERILAIRAENLIGAEHAAKARGIPIYDSNGDIVSPDQNPAFRTKETGDPFIGGAVGIDRPDGQRVWVSGSSRLLNPDDPEHSAMVLSFTDITAQRFASERLSHEAAHDVLTGLPNRARVIARVAEALESGGDPVLAAVLYIDLDDLKAINDSLGHDAGDNALRIAAQRLRLAVRPGDVVARLGGDEFVALLGGPITGPDLEQLAERLHATLSEPVVIAGGALRIGASIGIVVVEPNDPRDARQVLRDADTAMYAAKAKGRGTSHYFTDHRTDQLRDRIRTERQVTTEHDTPNRARPEQLRRPLGSRTTIDQAIGIIRSRAGGTVDEAFDWLLRMSQSENVKLAVAAHRVVEEAVYRVEGRHREA